ncbi:MAG: hypothetical protein WD512_07800 [Candidatus Paceibacterota bacterium]
MSIKKTKPLVLKGSTKKSDCSNLTKNFLNLTPALKLNQSLDCWRDEINSIHFEVDANTQTLPELMIAAVTNKMELMGSEKEEIEEFLRFYLEIDPTVLQKL